MKNNKKSAYKLLMEAYEGTGGFFDGGRLIRHPREDGTKYEQRRRAAYYLNYLKPCVDAHVTPIFKSLAVRDYKGSGAKAWEKFISDVDFSGTHIKDLMKRAAKLAKLNGVAFIVMDSALGEGQETTLQALEEERARLPYAFVVHPLQVEEIELDKFGRISKFIYEEPDPEQENIRARRTLTPQGWQLDNSRGTSTGQWNLGVTPVIPLFAREHDNFDALPPSDFMSIAQTNLAIYNMSSWLSDILINQTFSILVYPDTNHDAIEIGTNNALGYPADAAHEPAFIAPDSGPATIISENIERLQQECYRMASVVNVTGVKVQSSGTAKAWDYEQTNQILSDFADRIEAAEKNLAALFARWLGVELDYTCNYPNDYSIADVETELANADVAKGLAFGDAFNVEVFKKVLTSYLPELADDDFDALVESYKEQQEQEKLDMQHQFDDEVDDDEEDQAGQQGGKQAGKQPASGVAGNGTQGGK
ncbi:MAG: DUF4055 domain-containing protein [Phascolarctobacterium sp.]|uniref:DUF4055 domain-containing protein n=1 Tax=Phascolarctobacterium sp. TaxID=2049039 RepID=UPI0026DB94D6|nr:DUF4055 domain-containing protein [Phascolarctobacterium sp.]MDO4920936.1 DUF4055 domain-containing protein [Phascolarctobacterium sp.]